MISSASIEKWQDWIDVTRSRCHLNFELAGGTIERHVSVCRESARATAGRVRTDLPGSPSAILEIGSSVGFNCLALAEECPGATVTGIEPDHEAVSVGNEMAADFGLTNVVFVQGVGENLPFADESFDWIVCHTVIEHVRDVEACIMEIARVLRPGGYLHLEAPNYIWPVEPHLGIFMPPLCPKPLMRSLARFQGKGERAGYIEHLQLVHPAQVERCFAAHALQWTNRAERKLRCVASGQQEQVIAYKWAAKTLSLLNHIGLAPLVVGILLKTRLYPSLLYTVHKPRPH
ncbi:MAG: class I SAM-dependent methyltransferase [Nitrospirae bacterium]|nr:MAG: class I SAM-dependent methyltransferase [Nitrospirota bacterium]